jgi:CheY-like chemotaxis protein
MNHIRLIHWNAEEARQRIEDLSAGGVEVRFRPLSGPSALHALERDPPQAVIIDLSRLPSQGRDLAIWLRRRQRTRHVPLVLVGGDPDKVDRLRGHLPDAVYSDWRQIHSALKRALAEPPKRPVVPSSALAGYSGTPLPKKLGIRADSVVALIGAPEGFEETLGPLPEGAELRRSGRGRRDLTLCFVASRKELERRIDRLVKAAEQGSVWIAWPKKASGRATDLAQAEVRRTGLSSGLVDYKICAIDETWSGLLFARRRG